MYCNELVCFSPCGILGDRDPDHDHDGDRDRHRQQLLHLDDQTCAFPLERQDWCEYGPGALRKATVIKMTLTHHGCMVDSTIELPPIPQVAHSHDHDLGRDRMGIGSVMLSGPNGCLVERTNKLVVGGVQLAGRTLEASRNDPWHINPIHDNGHALSVVWVQQPEGSTPTAGLASCCVCELIVFINRGATTAASCHRGWGHAMG